MPGAQVPRRGDRSGNVGAGEAASVQAPDHALSGSEDPGAVRAERGKGARQSRRLAPGSGTSSTGLAKPRECPGGKKRGHMIAHEPTSANLVNCACRNPGEVAEWLKAAVCYSPYCSGLFVFSDFPSVNLVTFGA